MINVSSDSDGLKTLQREADELRESRGKNFSTGVSVSQSVSQTLQEHDEEQCEKESSAKSVLLDLSDQVELQLKETEETVSDDIFSSSICSRCGCRITFFPQIGGTMKHIVQSLKVFQRAERLIRQNDLRLATQKIKGG